jgi:hypothetical protein
VRFESLLSRSMKIETHRIESPTLSGICTMIEQPNRIVFRLRWKDGEPDTDVDADAVVEWLLPITMRYKDDPRPILIDGIVCAEDAANLELAVISQPVELTPEQYAECVRARQARAK